MKPRAPFGRSAQPRTQPLYPAKPANSGLATHLEFTMPLGAPGEVEALRALLAELKQP